MKFLLVDRLTQIERGESIAGHKSLSLAEEYLADHFPGFPVMPGVLMLEALTQLGAWLMRVTEDFRYSTVLLKQAKAVKYNNFLQPGKSLLLEAAVSKRDESTYTFKGNGTVDGINAVSAKLTLTQFNLADKAPERSEADERLREHWRAVFAQIDATNNSTPAE